MTNNYIANASFFSRPTWTTFPATIQWLQSERNKIVVAKDDNSAEQKNKGMNATIILLSATCLEGFLVECLESYVSINRFASESTFEGRLAIDFLKRISTATFNDYPDLFRLTLGRKISECIEDKDLIDGVVALISFRNGLAHARSISYKMCETKPNEYSLEVEHQYNAIHKYLVKQNLIKGHDEMLANNVADHFYALLKPYMEKVLALLPVPQSDVVISLFNFAYTGVVT